MFDGVSASEDERERLNRRQLLKAGAWAAPALVLATAAPAAAGTSGTVSVGTPTLGGRGLAYSVSVTATASATTTIVGTIVITPAEKGTWPDGTSGPQSVTAVIPAGGSATLAFPTFTRSNNGNDQVHYTITFTVNGVADASLTRSGELKHKGVAPGRG